MANITIYVPDNLHQRVKAADLPISRLCQEALMNALEHQEKAATDAKGMERVEVTIKTRDGLFLTKAFRGKFEGSYDLNGFTYDFYKTAKGAAVVYVDGRNTQEMMMYQNREELLDSGLPPVIVDMVSEDVFDTPYVEELDI